MWLSTDRRHAATVVPTTWCELRSDGTNQCRACKVERFFERVLYPPLGYRLQTGSGRSCATFTARSMRKPDCDSTGAPTFLLGSRTAKAFFWAAFPIYHLLMEDEPQAEAYGVASARDQASIVYKAAALLVQSNSALQNRLKVLESTKRIIERDNSGLYAVLSADGDVQDGKRPSLLLFDELHRFTRKKAETVRTVLLKGMISRSPVVNGVQQGEPLMIQTTTSGDEHECPLWFSEYEYARHVLDGSIEDSSYYAAIYQADTKRIESDPEYWKSREARVAANPSHEDNGGFLADSAIEAEMKEAIARPEKYSGYIRLNLNVPCVSTGTPVINMPLWCEGDGGVDLRIEAKYDVEALIRRWGLAGQSCFAGIDLAWTTDMAALALLFPPAPNLSYGNSYCSSGCRANGSAISNGALGRHCLVGRAQDSWKPRPAPRST